MKHEGFVVFIDTKSCSKEKLEIGKLLPSLDKVRCLCVCVNAACSNDMVKTSKQHHPFMSPEGKYIL